MARTGQRIFLCIVACLVATAVRGQVCTNTQSNPYTKIWTIAIGHDWGAYEYLNEGGYLTGFSTELIGEVCAAANINCRTLWLPYTLCWKSEKGQHSTGGDGLLGGWIDACSGWMGTIDRVHVYDFSMEFLKQEEAFFYTKKGVSFNTGDLSEKRLGFLDGWASDEKCLIRAMSSNNFVPDKEKIKYIPTAIELAQALKDNVVEVAFSFESALSGLLESYDLQRQTAKSYKCAITGVSIMTRKDADFNHYWNIGFMKIRNNGHFKRLCQQAKDNHGHKGPVECVDT